MVRVAIVLRTAVGVEVLTPAQLARRAGAL
jgi:hypothetical protein